MERLAGLLRPVFQRWKERCGENELVTQGTPAPRGGRAGAGPLSPRGQHASPGTLPQAWHSDLCVSVAGSRLLRSHWPDPGPLRDRPFVLS